MSYPGGKGASGVAQTIINEQPPHETYIEPFLGGGAVMRAKRPARANYGFDVEPDAPGFDLCYLEQDHPTAASGDRRPRFQFRVTDGIRWLKENGFRLSESTLVYCDPPYPLSIRRQHRRLYRNELTDDDHARLLKILDGLPCMVQVSSYWNSLYAQMLESWRLIRFSSMTRGGPAEECLWMNYPAPAALHDYRYLGADFRERERIARKTKRWTARISKLPELERMALYSAIASTIAENGASGSSATNERCLPSPFSAVRSCDRTTPQTEMLQ